MDGHFQKHFRNRKSLSKTQTILNYFKKFQMSLEKFGTCM